MQQQLRVRVLRVVSASAAPAPRPVSFYVSPSCWPAALSVGLRALVGRIARSARAAQGLIRPKPPRLDALRGPGDLLCAPGLSPRTGRSLRPSLFERRRFEGPGTPDRHPSLQSIDSRGTLTASARRPGAPRHKGAGVELLAAGSARPQLALRGFKLFGKGERTQRRGGRPLFGRRPPAAAQ